MEPKDIYNFVKLFINMVRIANVHYKYPKSKKVIFQDFSLTLKSGNVYGLLGKNGAGKSTLLYLISGLLYPQRGDIYFREKNVGNRLPVTLSDMFLVPEEFELPNISLENYIKNYSPFYPKFSTEEMKHCLNVFEISEDVHLGALSMGQKKKVFMSFALATNASLVLMDEPTNGLDIPGKSQFRKFMTSLMNETRTVVISTHQVRDIDKILDHVLIIDDSKLLLDAGVDEITKKLLFVENRNPDSVENVLYSQSSIGGNSLVLENIDEEESVLNLETLFNATLSEYEKISLMFNRK